VAFGSFAENLVSADTNVTSNVFVRDRQNAVTYLVDVNDEGQEANRGTPDIAPAITADGVQIGFVSLASNLAGPDNDANDVFVVCNPALRTPPSLFANFLRTGSLFRPSKLSSSVRQNLAWQ